MQFSCEKSILQEAITTASRAVSNKSSIALLEGLLITADAAGGLTLCGYNGRSRHHPSYCDRTGRRRSQRTFVRRHDPQTAG